MERVHFEQERMVEELKDLVDRGLFTEKETKQILKKRTHYETLLIRRVAKKSDFLRYAAYEMGLEALRRKRVHRIEADGPRTVSDYGMVKRQFEIFERALVKFKSDVGIWVQYIQVAKREGATERVGRVLARAVQTHPGEEQLWVMSAQWEMQGGSVTGARGILMRGIRMNGTSAEVWREWVRMERWAGVDGVVDEVERQARMAVPGIEL
ncbi:U3 small nucleolar RNA-associated protein 6-domain-containing protein [Crepidotus variabilis]|uniref:U3 small nucleolar RNA-associated protein 6-domain-containing protein n=1 Tax=Crepidotus variabilis TaxID=179855 RepID=A0A9P6EGB0_9AGAR|nr:U3 small nucleolar RNA-associated protein 6-domain-containing protein [Crepidotus variabilis]